MVMSRLANGDEGGQGVTDHGQAQRGKPSMWAGGQFERQWDDMAPRLASWPQPAGQRAHRQDRDGKSAVLAVAADDGGCEFVRFDGAKLLLEPTLGAIDHRAMVRRGVRHGPEGGPAERGGAEVAEATIGVPPTA